MENTNKKKRKTNLDDEIYLLTYALPMYKDEISQNIYGIKGHPTIISKIKQLEKKKWISICNYEDLIKIHHRNIGLNLDEKHTDKRRNLRQYVIANPDILLEKILDRLRFNDCELTEDEKKELRNYITNEDFLSKVQDAIEASYPVLPEFRKNFLDYSGEIQDVFYSMLNFIILDSVFFISYYNRVDEMCKAEGLKFEDGGSFVEGVEKYFLEFQKNKSEKHRYPMSLPLLKKLCKLDVHTSNKLMQQYTLFGDYIFAMKERIKELKKQDELKEKKNKKRIKKRI